MHVDQIHKVAILMQRLVVNCKFVQILIVWILFRLDPFTLVADYISPVLNTPMLSYEDSGPFMLMEKELIRQMVKRVYKSDVGDGIITDGGSMANQIAIAMAKYSVTGENFKKMGYRAFWGKKYVIFTSGDAHYSTKKGAIFQGNG